MALREKLTQRWPGYVIPPMPNTTLIGNTVEENIKYREAFINNFLRKLSAIPDIYYSDCVQSLLKSFEGTG